ARETKAVERFRREARAAARMHHTNIVPIFEVGRDGDVCWYTMQLIQGQSLDQIVEELRRLRESSQEGQPRRPLGELPASKALSPQTTRVSQLTQLLLTEEFAPEPFRGSSEVGREPESGTTPVVVQGQAEFASERSDHLHYIRSVARIGQQAASALAYAHAR